MNEPYDPFPGMILVIFILIAAHSIYSMVLGWLAI
jgi:hypothetical protein